MNDLILKIDINEAALQAVFDQIDAVRAKALVDRIGEERAASLLADAIRMEPRPSSNGLKFSFRLDPATVEHALSFEAAA